MSASPSPFASLSSSFHDSNSIKDALNTKTLSVTAAQMASEEGTVGVEGDQTIGNLNDQGGGEEPTFEVSIFT